MGFNSTTGLLLTTKKNKMENTKAIRQSQLVFFDSLIDDLFKDLDSKTKTILIRTMENALDDVIRAKSIDIRNSIDTLKIY